MKELRCDFVRVEVNERLPRRTFSARGVPLHVGAMCIVEHNGTLEIGRVIGPADNWIGDGSKIDPREIVVREATEADLDQQRATWRMDEEARRYCTQLVREKKLEMKISRAWHSFDRSKLRIFFTSENRVDFRELVRDLAAHFRKRIEMRQFGVREESRMVGGIGICGLELCCSKWLVKLVPISIKMAKEQGLALNPQNVSGMCGRLLCCLSYEYENYRGARKLFPRVGSRVIVSGEEGIVHDVNILQRTLIVNVGGKHQVVPLDRLTIERPAIYPDAVQETPAPPAAETGAGGRSPRRKRKKRSVRGKPRQPLPGEGNSSAS